LVDLIDTQKSVPESLDKRSTGPVVAPQARGHATGIQTARKIIIKKVFRLLSNITLQNHFTAGEKR
jgi:hypothetical protein